MWLGVYVYAICSLRCLQCRSLCIYVRAWNCEEQQPIGIFFSAPKMSLYNNKMGEKLGDRLTFVGTKRTGPDRVFQEDIDAQLILQHIFQVLHCARVPLSHIAELILVFRRSPPLATSSTQLHVARASREMDFVCACDME